MTRLPCAVVALTLAAASSAEAKTITTPLLRRNTDQGDIMTCMVLNSGSKAIGPFTIEIVQSDGVAIGGVTSVPSLEPGVGAVKSTGLGTDDYLYCRVDGFVSPKSVSVSLCLWQSTDDDTCMAAVTAP